MTDIRWTMYMTGVAELWLQHTYKMHNAFNVRDSLPMCSLYQVNKLTTN